MEGSKCFINRGNIVKKNPTMLKEGKGHHESLMLSALIALVAGEKHLSDFTQRSQLHFFLKLILIIIINYGFLIQSVTLLKLAAEQPLNS